MYNEELKNRYIRECVKSELTEVDYRTLFNTIQKYEEKWDADICTIKSTAELQPVIENLSGIRENSRRVRLGFLRNYVRWCIDNNVEGSCDSLLKIQVSTIDRIKTLMVSGPKHLQKCLDEICDPVEDGTIDCIYRCYYWLAFGGMEEEDIVMVKTTSVDLESMEVHWEGENFPIYREAIPAFKSASKATQFVYKNPTYSNDIIRNRCQGDTLIRGIRALPSPMSLRVELSRRQKKAIESGKTNVKLSYSRVKLSGVFYRQYENERAGIGYDFKDVVKMYTGGREYKLDSCGLTQEGKLRQIEREFIADYNRWKRVFS